MSLETAAGTVADRIKRQEFIEVYAHQHICSAISGLVWKTSRMT
jgi:hypothetical protein